MPGRLDEIQDRWRGATPGLSCYIRTSLCCENRRKVCGKASEHVSKSFRGVVIVVAVVLLFLFILFFLGLISVVGL